MNALITGASGLIGKALLERLGEARVLTRDVARAERELGVRAFGWRPEAGPPAPTAFDGIDVVFHLAGEPVAGRWTAEKKRRIRDSRVLATAEVDEEGVAVFASRGPGDYVVQHLGDERQKRDDDGPRHVRRDECCDVALERPVDFGGSLVAVADDLLMAQHAIPLRFRGHD